jgi:O-antigen/teichoic acid export membrane protein
MLYNPKVAALFAIGVTMLTFTRTLMSAFFSPFQTKFNHLRGLRDDSMLNTYFSKLVELAAPISLILPIGIIVLMRPLIIAWIGFDYTQSIMISRVLMINLMFAFIAGPINLVALAKEKYRFLLISSLALPLFYLVFFLLLNKNFGLISLPMAKVLTIFSSLLINLILFKTVMSFPLGKLLSNIVFQISFPLLLLAGLLFITMPMWDIEVGKDIFVFFKIITIGGVCISISSLSYYFINPNTRNLISRLLVKFKLRLWAR